jgi:hypothetical protein
MLYFVFTALTVFVHVLTRKRVTADVTYGSVAAYLLVGMIAARVETQQIEIHK